MRIILNLPKIYQIVVNFISIYDSIRNKTADLKILTFERSKKMKSLLYLFAAFLFFGILNLPLSAEIIHVPSQYAQIQLAISAADPGDTILVADGIYTGPNNKDIDFIGKDITLVSENGLENCIIDCEGEGRGFYLHQEESNSTLISGFTIANGLVESSGGGILIGTSSPKIKNCKIIDNSCDYRGGGIFIGYWNNEVIISDCIISGNNANHSGGGITVCSESLIENCEISGNSANYEGGGIEVDQSSPTISNCTIKDNFALGGGDCGGGGIMAFKAAPTISHCLITDNNANAYGGGVLLSDAGPDIFNCTISRNSARFGGGIFFEVYYSTTTMLSNTIVEGNLGQYGLYFQWPPDAEISYCDFYNNQLGEFYNPPAGVGSIVSVNANGDSCDIFNNILLDPMFLNPAVGDFHLLEDSPCIDAGDPLSPLDPDSTISDIGAFYFDQLIVNSQHPEVNQVEDYFLLPPCPNPFNRSTVISFELRASSYLELKAYDIMGREVAKLIEGYENAGNHQVHFNGSELSSGIYFVILESGDYRKTQKLLLIK